MIRLWRILGYGVTRGYKRLSTISMAEVDKGSNYDDLEKWCQLAEDRSNKAKREADQLRFNLKSRDGADIEFSRKLASGRYHGRG